MWNKFKKWIVQLCVNLFGRNYWGWAHLTTSAILCSIWYRIFPNNWTWQTLRFGLAIVVFFAILWEMYEYWYEIRKKGLTVEKVYGTKKHYWQDTLGDIILAIIGWIIALI